LPENETDPGLMEALGIANEYWHNPRVKQVDEQSSKIYRYQVQGLVRGERHIYTSDVLCVIQNNCEYRNIMRR